MTYLDDLKEFWTLTKSQYVPANTQALYYVLLQINNECHWEPYFFRTNQSLCDILHLSKTAFATARNQLIQLGLIEVIPSKKRGECTRYRLLKVTNRATNQATNVQQTCNKCAANQATTMPHNETKIKTKTKTKSESVLLCDQSPQPKRQRFVPPTLDEVKNYCLERKNNVSPERFVDYYTANGWQVGKNKMKDWKAAVRTWENNHYDCNRTQKQRQSENDDWCTPPDDAEDPLAHMKW